jgi:hypothetical protein
MRDDGIGGGELERLRHIHPAPVHLGLLQTWKCTIHLSSVNACYVSASQAVEETHLHLYVVDILLHPSCFCLLLRDAQTAVAPHYV